MHHTNHSGLTFDLRHRKASMRNTQIKENQKSAALELDAQANRKDTVASSRKTHQAKQKITREDSLFGA